MPSPLKLKEQARSVFALVAHGPAIWWNGIESVPGGVRSLDAAYPPPVGLLTNSVATPHCVRLSRIIAGLVVGHGSPAAYGITKKDKARSSIEIESV
jgi:hypothetical protein